MRDATLAGTVLIDASAQAVWDYLTDWPRQAEWMPLTMVEPVGEQTAGSGTRIRAYTGIWRLRFSDPMTITTWDPPHRLQVAHTGRVVRGEAGFVLQPTPAAVELTWRERFLLPAGAVGALGWRLTAPLWQRGLDRSLRRLARRIAATDRTCDAERGLPAS